MYTSHISGVTRKSGVRINIRAPSPACHVQRVTRVNIHIIAYLSIDVKYEIVGYNENINNG